MNQDLKVSLIVAIYKSEKFLPKLIESLINQTYKNIEIILVDDGSPDNSGVICDSYATKDSRIKVIHKKNGGACEARNFGLKASTGDYLMIIDGDDWLAEDCVEYLLNIALTTNSDMAMSVNIFTSRDQTQIASDSIEVWSSEKATAKLIYPGIEIGPWNKIYKRDLIIKNDISFSVPWSGEGLYFATRATQFSNQVGVGKRKVYNYRLNNPNSGLTKLNVIMGTNALANIIYIGENLVLKSKYVQNAVQWHIWKNYNFVLYLIIGTGEKEKYNKEYKNSLRMIRKLMLPVFFKSDLRMKQRIRIIVQSLFPRSYAKHLLKLRLKKFGTDIVS